MWKRVGVVITTALFIIQLFTGAVVASASNVGTAVNTGESTETAAASSVTATEESFRSISYADYQAQYTGAIYPDTQIEIPAAQYSQTTGPDCKVVDSLDGKSDVLVTGEDGTVTWQFSVTDAGFYNVRMLYYPVEGNGATIERSLYIDGEIPFEAARSINFLRTWKDSGEKVYDSHGNEYRREQVEDRSWTDYYLTSSSDYSGSPFYVYLSAGAHTVSLEAVSEPLALSQICFCQQENVKSYQEVLQEYQAKGYKAVDSSAASVKVQGEDASLKSSASLYAVEDGPKR